ncbi:TonB family protein [Granulicella sp. dw_53]|uniref:TonB family protein n=1 Tax=Granulicella sp. dw_53 TaxID=2719792 RepID=UPI001BD1FD94|nr:TonB family protein [Granulicella sp. dw_53]
MINLISPTSLITHTPLSAQELVHALGWTLLHFCWQGALVATILWCLLTLLSNRSPQTRYVAACCALALMTALPLLTFAHLITSHNTPYATRITLVPNSPLTNLHDGSGPSEPLLNHIARVLDQSMPRLLPIWFAGVVLLLARLSIGLIVANRMKSAATQTPSLELHRTFHQLARRLEVTRSVILMHSTLVQVPTVIGWLRPIVLLPLSCLAGLSTIQVEAILAHELAHIRRHDYLVGILQFIVEALLFYHPAVWWVSKQIRKEREHCCDDLAVRIGGDALTYAKALSFLEEQRSPSPAVALGANGGILAMRIRRILGSKQTPAVSQPTALVLLSATVLVVGLGIGTVARAQPGPQLQEIPTTNGHTPTGQYLAWLDEDVLWIISPAERAAFIQLTSNAERDHFIEQFWLRRDPTLGDSKLSYREEHYRRIAYANQHFATTVDGWKTDRGRIYIVYGTPDTIDAYPAGAPEFSGKPAEAWHYRSLIGVGQNIEVRFVDLCNCGNYQLQSQTASGKSLSNASSPNEPLTVQTQMTHRPIIRKVAYSSPARDTQPTASTDPAQNTSTVPRRIGNGVSAPTILYAPIPEYTESAKQEKISGPVLLNLWVDEQGKPSHVHVLRGIDKGLDEKAIEAVKQYKFKPAMQDDKPVLVQLNIEVNLKVF